MRRRYGLGETSTTSKTVDALEEQAIVLRDGGAVLFDDPFYRAWVIASVLPDVGMRLPITHVPQH